MKPDDAYCLSFYELEALSESVLESDELNLLSTRKIIHAIYTGSTRIKKGKIPSEKKIIPLSIDGRSIDHIRETAEWLKNRKKNRKDNERKR